MSTNVVISAGSVTVTVPVTTNEDNFVEPEEYFSATLSLPGSPDTVVIGSPDVAYVTIIDERGSGLRESLIHLVTQLISSQNAHQLSNTMLICTFYILFSFTAMIQVQFNASNYSVTEGVDSNAVITLETIGDHPEFGFSVTVATQNGSAIREFHHDTYMHLGAHSS